FGDGPLPIAGPYQGTFVAKFDPKGKLLWSKSLTADVKTSEGALALGLDGSVAITGYLGGTTDLGGGLIGAADAMSEIFVAMLDPSGSHQWSRAYSNLLSQSIATDAFGNVSITGELAPGKEIDFGGGALPGPSIVV